MQALEPAVGTDSAASWVRLAICVALCSIGGVAMWSVVVVLPAVQAEFGVDRGVASLSYSAVMAGFALGSVVLGRITDRFGVKWPVFAASAVMASGYALAGAAGALWQFMLVHFLLIGLLGGAVTFGPLMAHVSLWFVRRRGIAVALCASGSYFAGTFWPPVLQYFVRQDGWRAAYVGTGLFCAATMLPLALLLRGRPPALAVVPARGPGALLAIDLSPRTLQWMLIVAGLACCMAMATPQVHIVAYCVDLGYGAGRGAEMLSLMLAFGVVSRVSSGWLADRIGGVRTLLLGSALQGAALLLYTQFDGLGSLYVISAMFGLFQGGIVPSYAVVVREFFPAREAGGRIGLVLMATMVGMALGGWAAGAIDDWSGSYRISFAAGVLWNALNGAIVLTLLLRRRGGEQGFSGVPVGR